MTRDSRSRSVVVKFSIMDAREVILINLCLLAHSEMDHIGIVPEISSPVNVRSSLLSRGGLAKSTFLQPPATLHLLINDRQKGGAEAILVKDAIPAMSHHLSGIPYHDVQVCDIGSTNIQFTIICIYLTPGGNSQNAFPLLTRLRTLFDSSSRFILVGGLNTGHVDWDSLSCNNHQSSFHAKLLDLVQDLLVFQHVRETTCYRFDTPPSLLDVVLIKDDPDVYDMELCDPFRLSDYSTVQFLVDWKPRISQIPSFKRRLQGRLGAALEYAGTLY